VSAEAIKQFRECAEGNPYIVVHHINTRRMEIGFLNLEGLAMLCSASQGTNVSDNICLARLTVKGAQLRFTDFISYLQNFDGERQVIYLIDLCRSLRAFAWNVAAVNACEAALQNAFRAFSLQGDTGTD
jgi:hypothetical protein